jgi:hypothetical protein
MPHCSEPSLQHFYQLFVMPVFFRHKVFQFVRGGVISLQIKPNIFMQFAPFYAPDLHRSSILVQKRANELRLGKKPSRTFFETLQNDTSFVAKLINQSLNLSS